MNDVLTIVLTHQAEPSVGRMLDYWHREVPGTDLWLAYGGTRTQFDSISFPNKTFIEKGRLRTKDHQREKQSYSTIFNKIAEAISKQPYQFIWFMEYDHIPLISNAPQVLRQDLERQSADLLGHHLLRVDQTIFAHYLYHLSDANFLAFWQKYSVRQDTTTVLTMLGCGSFWRREAFNAVAAIPEDTPIYLEIYFPTLAHHLGFRVREATGQNGFVTAWPMKNRTIDMARKANAWTFHPHKTIWDVP
jgi:hypothetical protein